MHHVRARTPRFACGGDDYLFILFDGISQVRAIPPPAPATAAATAAIAAPRSCCRVSVLCCSLASCPLPMGLTGRGLLLPARSYWQLGWRVTSGKFRSGILPQFQHQLRASLFCVVGRVTRALPQHTSAMADS